MTDSVDRPIPHLPDKGKQSFDDMLKIVAKKVDQNSAIDDLGSALGFGVEARDHYIAMNHRYQNITNDGTLQMLRDWRKGQTESTECLTLKTALKESGNIHLADDLFGKAGASFMTDTGGYEIIRLKEHNIEVKVPANEKWGAKDIKVQALTEVPPELMELLKKDEAVTISFGLEMTPSDAKFSTPVEVTMPHSAIFKVLPTDPSSFGMYYRGKGAGSFTLIHFTRDDRRCVVRKKDLTLYVDHFCEWWIVAFIKRTLWGTRPVILTPYLPKRIERGNSQQVLYLCVRDSGKENDVELEGQYAKLPSRSYPINMKSGDLKVRCRASGNEVDEVQTLPITRFHHLFNAEVHFIFHTARVSQETEGIHIEFSLKQKCDDSDCLAILCFFRDRDDRARPDTVVDVE